MFSGGAGRGGGNCNGGREEMEGDSNYSCIRGAVIGPLCGRRWAEDQNTLGHTEETALRQEAYTIRNMYYPT